MAEERCPRCRREVDYSVAQDLERSNEWTPDSQPVWRYEFRAIHKEDVKPDTILVFKNGISVSHRREKRAELGKQCQKEVLPGKTCPECNRSQGHSKKCSRNKGTLDMA